VCVERVSKLCFSIKIERVCVENRECVSRVESLICVCQG